MLALDIALLILLWVYDDQDEDQLQRTVRRYWKEDRVLDRGWFEVIFPMNIGQQSVCMTFIVCPVPFSGF